MSYPSNPQPDPTPANPYQAYQPAPPPPYPPSPYGPPTQPGQPAPSGGTNGFAVASLVLGILGMLLFSVIFAIIALVQIPRRNQTGKGLAIGGLAASGAWTLILIVGITAAVIAASDDDTTPSSNPASSPSSAVEDLAVGDCVNGLLKLDLDQELRRNPPTVACAEPHEGEVYHVIKLTGATFPGDDAIQKKAEDGCADALSGYAPDEKTKDLEVYYLYPTRRSWTLGDRDITCLAVSEGAKLTGSLRD